MLVSGEESKGEEKRRNAGFLSVGRFLCRLTRDIRFDV